MVNSAGVSVGKSRLDIDAFNWTFKTVNNKVINIEFLRDDRIRRENDPLNEKKLKNINIRFKFRSLDLHPYPLKLNKTSPKVHLIKARSLYANIVIQRINQIKQDRAKRLAALYFWDVKTRHKHLHENTRSISSDS